MADQVEKKWYVMRDLKRHNAHHPAWKDLPAKGFEVFTPMVSRLIERNGKKERKECPFIPDLVFVHSDKASIEKEMKHTPTLQFRYYKGSVLYRDPMTVRDQDMDRFVQAVRSSHEPRYFRPEELTSDHIGKRIRLVDGPMAGYEGMLLKLRGRQKRRILVELENYLVAAIEVEKDYIEFI